jgi:hypothetical protein
MQVFASGCCVLVAESDPVVAMDLHDTLTRFGCTVLGPVDSSAAGFQLLLRQRPNFALLSASLYVDAFLPLAELLSLTDVPYALIATSQAPALLGSSDSARGEAHLAEPFGIGALYQLARGLYRNDLELRIQKVDAHIAAGISGVAGQVRKVEQLAAFAHAESLRAEAMLTEMIHALHQHRTSRAAMVEELAALA